jgi:hypothetical protein
MARTIYTPESQLDAITISGRRDLHPRHFPLLESSEKISACASLAIAVGIPLIVGGGEV